MNEQAIRFRFGIFVLASLILLAVLIILFGGFPNYFKKTEGFTIVFKNAQGIAPGTPIKRSGVRIGEVRTVALDSETGKVNVGIRIDENYFLRKCDRPTLVQGLLGGDSAIAFVPPEDEKNADKSPVETGAVLDGVNPADAGMLMQKAADLTQPAKEALDEIRKTFKEINKLGPVVEGTLKDFREVGKMAKDVGPEVQKTAEEIRALAKTTRDAVPEVLKTNQEIRAMAQETRKTIPELKKTNEEVQAAVRNWSKVGERVDVLLKTNEDKIVKTIARAEEAVKRMNDLLGDENQKAVRDTLRNFRNASGQLDSLAKDTGELIKDSRVAVKRISESLKKAEGAADDLQKALKPLGERGPTILKNVEESTDHLNKTLKDMRELMQVIARSDGTVQKLLSDPALYNNLNDSATMMTRILPRVDRVLRDVETFADKLARHPELIGLGGVIRPSTGLKESPLLPSPRYRVFP